MFTSISKCLSEAPISNFPRYFERTTVKPVTSGWVFALKCAGAVPRSVCRRLPPLDGPVGATLRADAGSVSGNGNASSLRAFPQVVGANDTIWRVVPGTGEETSRCQLRFHKVVFFPAVKLREFRPNMRSLTEGTIEVRMTPFIPRLSF